MHIVSNIDLTRVGKQKDPKLMGRMTTIVRTSLRSLCMDQIKIYLKECIDIYSYNIVDIFNSKISVPLLYVFTKHYLLKLCNVTRIERRMHK
jgi:hypothetical protein